MTRLSLTEIECELKQRLEYPYEWGGCKQNDHDDHQTDLIYHIPRFADLLARIEKQYRDGRDAREYQRLKNYALNRWFNFWSAVAVEEIFCSIPGVTPAKRRNRLVDFRIQGITFDHKTSVFPARYGRSVEEALAHPADLIRWLYTHQSGEQRKHHANRLFIILVDRTCLQESWKLRAEILWLRPLIENYVRAFDPAMLHKFCFSASTSTLADIIWAIKSA